MKFMNLIGAAVALACVAGAPAHAVTLNWTLHNVAFNDGGTASGTFSTDSANGQVTAFNIGTTAGTIRGAAAYNPATSTVFGYNIFSANSFTIVTKNTFNPYLNLSFAHTLASGGVNTLNVGGPGAGSWECSNCDALRSVISGSASTVPEPASWALMLVGFGGLGMALRAQRRTVRVAVAV